MKRLVSSDIDKLQEDMAWQMAEMIVKDITELNGVEVKSQEVMGSEVKQREVGLSTRGSMASMRSIAENS